MARKTVLTSRQRSAALREVGRIERSLFMIDWTTDPDMRRRAQGGLNKGEAHHTLKRAINFHQRGERRDRTEQGQHYRVARREIRPLWRSKNRPVWRRSSGFRGTAGTEPEGALQGDLRRSGRRPTKTGASGGWVSRKSEIVSFDFV